MPQVEVKFRPERAQPFGVTSAAVRDTVATMLRGTKVGEVFDEQKIFDVVVWSEPWVRRDIFALRRLPVELPNGGYVPLASVADVSLAPTPNEITREGGSRRIDVTCNVRAAISAPSRAISRRRSGRSRSRQAITRSCWASTPRASSRGGGCWRLAFLSLVGHPARPPHRFRIRMRLVALVWSALTMPFALIGGVAAVFLTGGVLSLGSLVGFVTVLGIAARNGIMLVSHYRHLEHEEGDGVRPSAGRCAARKSGWRRS